MSDEPHGIPPGLGRISLDELVEIAERYNARMEQLAGYARSIENRLSAAGVAIECWVKSTDQEFSLGWVRLDKCWQFVVRSFRPALEDAALTDADRLVRPTAIALIPKLVEELTRETKQMLAKVIAALATTEGRS